MSEHLNDLLTLAIRGRYKNGPWGLVPMPRRVPRPPTNGVPVDTDEHHSVEYFRLYVHRNRLKPLGWPFGKHSLSDLERHFLDVLGRSQKVRLVLDQADVYVYAWQHNIIHLGPKTLSGAKAFMGLWEHVYETLKNECRACRLVLDGKLANKNIID